MNLGIENTHFTPKSMKVDIEYERQGLRPIKLKLQSTSDILTSHLMFWDDFLISDVLEVKSDVSQLDFTREQTEKCLVHELKGH